MIRLARPRAKPSSSLRTVALSWMCASGGVLNAKSSTTGSEKTITGSSVGVGSSLCCTDGRQAAVCAPRRLLRSLKRPAWCRPTRMAAVMPQVMTRIVGKMPNRRRATTESTRVAARTIGRRMIRPMPPNTTCGGPIPCSRWRLVQVPEQGGDTLAPADAHRHDPPLGLAPLQLIGQLDGEDRAGGADRMAEGDGAAVRVDLFGIDFQLPDDRDGLRRKGLVELHQIDVVDRHADFLEQVLDGENRRNPHDLGGDPSDRVRDPLELWVDSELRSLRPGHHHDGGTGIVDARGVARGHTAALPKSRLQAAERLDGGGRARMLIDLGDDRLTLLLRNGNRHDLVFEPALRDGGGCPPLALRCEGILRLAP